MGARTAAYQLQPDLAIAVDVTCTGDTPEAPVMAVELGKGPAIKVKDRSLISHPQVKNRLEETAKLLGIPYQLEILERVVPMPLIHLAREGILSGVISLPARYAQPGRNHRLPRLENAALLLCSLQHKDLFPAL